MEFDLKKALKKYKRGRTLRHVGCGVIVFAGAIAPAAFALDRTETLICWVGAFIFWTCAALEFRLKTMQIRLAEMDDKLVALSGGEPEGNLLLELNDW